MELRHILPVFTVMDAVKRCALVLGLSLAGAGLWSHWDRGSKPGKAEHGRSLSSACFFT